MFDEWRSDALPIMVRAPTLCRRSALNEGSFLHWCFSLCASYDNFVRVICIVGSITVRKNWVKTGPY